MISSNILYNMILMQFSIASQQVQHSQKIIPCYNKQYQFYIQNKFLERATPMLADKYCPRNVGCTSANESIAY